MFSASARLRFIVTILRIPFSRWLATVHQWSPCPCALFVNLLGGEGLNTGILALESDLPFPRSSLHLPFSSPAAASLPPAAQHLNLTLHQLTWATYQVGHLQNLSMTGCYTHTIIFPPDTYTIIFPPDQDTFSSVSQPAEWDLCWVAGNCISSWEKAEPSLRHWRSRR